MSHKETQKNAVLLSTHIVNEFVIQKYRKLCCDLDKRMYDVILLVNTDNGCELRAPDDIVCFTTSVESINELGYEPIEETLLPGSCHYPLLRFFTNNPIYRFYWFIEYDVEFTGNWSVLLNDCGKNLPDYDFLSCHVERYNEATNKNWIWWYKSNHVGNALKDCIKGFNPICRCSHGALSYLDKYQKAGHSAHSEVMITTCLYHGGFKIGDLGGTGEFVPDGYENKFYIPDLNMVNSGTMRHRPVYTQSEIESYKLPNKLFHPLKQSNSTDDIMWPNRMEQSHTNCVAVITHKLDDQTIRYFTYIKDKVTDVMDFIIIYDGSQQPINLDSFPEFNLFVFNSDSLNGFFHCNDRRLPNPFMALTELSKRTNYQHFLLIENDVVFTGDWSRFARQLNDEDVDYIHIASDNLGGPQNHWPIGHIKNNPFERMYFSWCQLFYISKRYLSDLERFMEDNDSFYYELLLPTMAYNKGYSIRQFENFGYHFQVSWGPTEVFEYKYQYERMSNTFYHPIKNLSIVEIPLKPSE